MDDKPKYWNPVLETLAPEKIRQLQLSKFKKIFKWTCENSKFHRRLYDRAGINPAQGTFSLRRSALCAS